MIIAIVLNSVILGGLIGSRSNHAVRGAAIGALVGLLLFLALLLMPA